MVNNLDRILKEKLLIPHPKRRRGQCKDVISTPLRPEREFPGGNWLPTIAGNFSFLQSFAEVNSLAVRIDGERACGFGSIEQLMLERMSPLKNHGNRLFALPGLGRRQQHHIMGARFRGSSKKCRSQNHREFPHSVYDTSRQSE